MAGMDEDPVVPPSYAWLQPGPVEFHAKVNIHEEPKEQREILDILTMELVESRDVPRPSWLERFRRRYFPWL
jgi:hypothetical protein